MFSPKYPVESNFVGLDKDILLLSGDYPNSL